MFSNCVVNLTGFWVHQFPVRLGNKWGVIGQCCHNIPQAARFPRPHVYESRCWRFLSLSWPGDVWFLTEGDAGVCCFLALLAVLELEAGGARSHPHTNLLFWASLVQVLLLRIIEKDFRGHLSQSPTQLPREWNLMSHFSGKTTYFSVCVCASGWGLTPFLRREVGYDVCGSACFLTAFSPENSVSWSFLYLLLTVFFSWSCHDIHATNCKP